jgi:hypothetical protein
MNGYIPPINPLLSGELLLYPWAHHLLVAGLVYGLKISPPTAFALINIGALLLTIILVGKIVKFLSYKRVVVVFAPLLSVFGFALFHARPIAKILHTISGVGFSLVDTRAVVISKFTNMNSMPLGILFFTLFLYSILNIFSEHFCRKAYYFMLVLSVLGTGLFYPIILLPLLVNCCIIYGLIYIKFRKKYLSKITNGVLCLTSGILLITPYLYQLLSDKSGSTFILTSSMAFILLKCFRYFLAILPVLIVLFWKRKVMLELLRTKTTSTLILITTTATTTLMYVLLNSHDGDGMEYKYMMLSLFSLGIIASVGLESAYSKNKIICFVLVLIFLIPFSTDFIPKLNNNGNVSDQFVENGMYLYHKNKTENALYKWISNKTKRDAIFVDSYLTIPVFGRRQLYVGLDRRRTTFDKRLIYSGGNLVMDGWSMKAEELLKTQMHPSEIIEKRIKLASEIYSDKKNEIDNDLLLELKKDSGNSNVYIVARDMNTNEKLSNSSTLNKVFEMDKTTVYQLISL